VGLLESWVESGSRWLDVGCGSGILSVVAHRLGASSVGAVDVDADALSVAREVVAQNEAREAVTLWNGSLPEVTLDRWDGVVANIDLPFFIDHAPHLARIPRPGGVLIASGFLARDARVVALRVTHAGLVVVRMEVAPPWAAVVARRVEP
jgi:ribosomal protein L11 methyltransferase